MVAIFPSLPGTRDPGTMTCYCPLGEHSTCDSNYAGARTKPASPAQVAAMLDYLKNMVGYKNLRVVARPSSHHRDERVRQIARR